MLLAIDTSTRQIGLALYEEDRVLHETIFYSQNYHTIHLAPAVQAAMGQVAAEFSDLTATAVALGPGSFTGLRIGMALAKGIALAQHIPILGIPSLDILAAGQPLADHSLAAVLKAGRGRLAVKWYAASNKNWQPIGELEVHSVESLSEQITKPTLICGELEGEERRILRRNRKLVSVASPAWSIRRPSFLAELAWSRFHKSDFDEPAQLSPIYLHSGDPIAS